MTANCTPASEAEFEHWLSSALEHERRGMCERATATAAGAGSTRQTSVPENSALEHNKAPAGNEPSREGDLA